MRRVDYVSARYGLSAYAFSQVVLELTTFRESTALLVPALAVSFVRSGGQRLPPKKLKARSEGPKRAESGSRRLERAERREAPG